MDMNLVDHSIKIIEALSVPHPPDCIYMIKLRSELSLGCPRLLLNQEN